MQSIPGLDHSYCPTCKKWIIEPNEITRLEGQLKRLDPTKKPHKELFNQIKLAKAQKTHHEAHQRNDLFATGSP